MTLSLLFLHPQSTHTQTASSYGVINARQCKAKQKYNKYCLPWKRKIKAKFSTWWTPFPITSKIRVPHGRKHSVFSFNSVGKPPKGKGCLTYELIPQEFSEFLKYLVALLSLSFIPERHIIRLKNSLSPDKQVYMWVKTAMAFISCFSHGKWGLIIYIFNGTKMCLEIISEKIRQKITGRMLLFNAFSFAM